MYDNEWICDLILDDDLFIVDDEEGDDEPCG